MTLIKYAMMINIMNIWDMHCIVKLYAVVWSLRVDENINLKSSRGRSTLDCLYRWQNLAKHHYKIRSRLCLQSKFSIFCLWVQLRIQIESHLIWNIRNCAGKVSFSSKCIIYITTQASRSSKRFGCWVTAHGENLLINLLLCLS